MSKLACSRIEILPEFKDFDMMGVVHNCVYFEWFERGRMDIIERIVPRSEMAFSQIAFAVRENYCKYLKAITPKDKLTLTTKHRICENYTGKFDFSYELSNSETREMHAEGSCVCVLLNLSENTLVKKVDAELWRRYCAI